MVHDKMIICEKEREERWDEQVRTPVFVTLTKIGVWDKSVCVCVHVCGESKTLSQGELVFW